MDQQVLSITEFCVAYGIGRTKAYEEIERGRLTAVKVGLRTLIRKSDAESWLANLPRIGEKKTESS